jgi:hypothetical protein
VGQVVRLVAASVWVAAAAGCHRYRPVTAAAVAPRDEVQLQLTPEGSRGLVPVLGPGVQMVEGVVRERQGDGALVLTGTQLVLEDGDRRSGPRAPVVIAAGAIARCDRRTLDRGRTRLTVAAIAGGFTAVVVSVLRSTRFRGQGQTGQGPGVPE